MKRDMELVRLLLIQCENGEEPSELSNYSQAEQIYNLQLMRDANLILADFVEDSTGEAQIASVSRLTWAGHDFLDATRDSKIWKMAKEQILKPGVSWTFSILFEWLKQEANKRILSVAPNS